MQLLIEVPCTDQAELKRLVFKLMMGLERKHILKDAIFVLGQSHWTLEGDTSEMAIVPKDVIVIHGATSIGGSFDSQRSWRHILKTEFKRATGIETVVVT